MKWIKVESTRILAMRHNPSTLVLDVKFRNGRVYRYTNVTISAFDIVRNSESVGRAFQVVIADNPKLTFEELKGGEIL